MKNRQAAGAVAERRKHPRIETENDVSYVLFNDSRQVTDQGRGKIRNLSQGGTLLETEKPLTGSFVILAALDLCGNKVKVSGRVANARQSDNTGGYRTGIQFRGSRDQKIRAIVTFVKDYSRRRQPDAKSRLYAVKSIEERLK